MQGTIQTGLAVAVGLALVYAICAATGTDSDTTVQMLIFSTLLLTMAVVYWYAHQTQRQAVAAEKQLDLTLRLAEEATSARYDESRPVLDIQRGSLSDFGTGMQALEEAIGESFDENHAWLVLKNVGRGPALNISARVGEKVFELRSLGSLETGETLGRHSFEVVNGIVEVAYEDIFGRKLFSSRGVNFDAHGPHVGPLMVGIAAEAGVGSLPTPQDAAPPSSAPAPRG